MTDLDTRLTPWQAISIKQPWAALIVAGKKTIEMRTWSTRFRGPVLIHAAKVADDRPEAWAWVDHAALSDATEIRGGIVGVAEVNHCRIYQSQRDFDADRLLHLNDSSWFRPPLHYGFELRNVRPVPFFPAKGQTLFFSVKGFTLT